MMSLWFFTLLMVIPGTTKNSKYHQLEIGNWQQLAPLNYFPGNFIKADNLPHLILLKNVVLLSKSYIVTTSLVFLQFPWNF